MVPHDAGDDHDREAAVPEHDQAGEPGRRIDRFIATRGLLLLLLEPLWVSPFFVPGNVLFQVLYAIGTSLLCMVALRRMSTGWLLSIGLGIAAFAEALAGLLFKLTGGPPVGLPGLADLPGGLLLTGGFFFRHLIIGYPLLPWLSVMILGTWLTVRTGLVAGALGVAVGSALGLYAGYAQNGQAGAIKDHATKTLPTLKMHYDMVLKLRAAK